MAISPLDGRYAQQIDPLRPFLSEFALIKFRVKVELEWLRKLLSLEFINKDKASELEALHNSKDYLDCIFLNFSESDGLRVKEIEKTTNHDVKAVEYFLKEKFEAGPQGLAAVKEHLHFACTSEDINNLSYALMLKESLGQVLIPQLEGLLARLTDFAASHKDVPMMCRTHGQSATPSTIGKEIANFAFRISR
jgi:adenylosuccinate lyase